MIWLRRFTGPLIALQVLQLLHIGSAALKGLVFMGWCIILSFHFSFLAEIRYLEQEWEKK